MKVSSVDDTIEELNPEPEAWQTTKITFNAFLFDVYTLQERNI